MAASPGEVKEGNKKRVKLLVYANLSYNGGFVGLKVTPKEPALWQHSLPMHEAAGELSCQRAPGG